MQECELQYFEDYQEVDDEFDEGKNLVAEVMRKGSQTVGVVVMVMH